MSRMIIRLMAGKRNKRPKEGMFVVKIDDWAFDFAFGLMPRSISADPYLDQRDIVLRGKLVEAPRKQIEFKTITIVASPELDDVTDRTRRQPKAVGFVVVSKGRMSVRLHCPAVAIAPLVQTLAADKVRYVRFLAENWHLKEALVKHYSLDEHLVADVADEIIPLS